MRGSTWLKLVAFALIVAGLGWTVRGLGFDVTKIHPERVREFVLSFGAWAPAIYLAAYGQPFVPLPASVMTITGGLAFGPLWGTLGALAGATMRACSQFLVARLLGREAVARLLKGKVAALNQKLGENSFKAVLLIRLIPNVPFDVQNYGLGFSRARFVPFALASCLGMIPGSFAFVYLGHSLTDPRHLWKLLVAILLLVGLMLAQGAWKRLHRALPSTEAR